MNSPTQLQRESSIGTQNDQYIYPPESPEQLLQAYLESQKFCCSVDPTKYLSQTDFSTTLLSRRSLSFDIESSLSTTEVFTNVQQIQGYEQFDVHNLASEHYQLLVNERCVTIPSLRSDYLSSIDDTVRCVDVIENKLQLKTSYNVEEDSTMYPVFVASNAIKFISHQLHVLHKAQMFAEKSDFDAATQSVIEAIEECHQHKMAEFFVEWCAARNNERRACKVIPLISCDAFCDTDRHRSQNDSADAFGNDMRTIFTSNCDHGVLYWSGTLEVVSDVKYVYFDVPIESPCRQYTVLTSRDGKSFSPLGAVERVKGNTYRAVGTATQVRVVQVQLHDPCSSELGSRFHALSHVNVYAATSTLTVKEGCDLFLNKLFKFASAAMAQASSASTSIGFSLGTLSVKFCEIFGLPLGYLIALRLCNLFTQSASSSDGNTDDVKLSQSRVRLLKTLYEASQDIRPRLYALKPVAAAIESPLHDDSMQYLYQRHLARQDHVAILPTWNQNLRHRVEILHSQRSVCSTGRESYALYNTPLSPEMSVWVWEMELSRDKLDAECTCFGIATDCVTNVSYKENPHVWLFRAFNGKIYRRGQFDATARSEKYHPGDTVLFVFDWSSQSLYFRVGKSENWAAIEDAGWSAECTLYPIVWFYSSRRQARIHSPMIGFRSKYLFDQWLNSHLCNRPLWKLAELMHQADTASLEDNLSGMFEMRRDLSTISCRVVIGEVEQDLSSLEKAELHTLEQNYASSPWSCHKCTFENQPQDPTCGVCHSSKPTLEAYLLASVPWSCSVCTLENSGTSTMCEACGNSASRTFDLREFLQRRVESRDERGELSPNFHLRKKFAQFDQLLSMNTWSVRNAEMPHSSDSCTVCVQETLQRLADAISDMDGTSTTSPSFCIFKPSCLIFDSMHEILTGISSMIPSIDGMESAAAIITRYCLNQSSGEISPAMFIHLKSVLKHIFASSVPYKQARELYLSVLELAELQRLAPAQLAAIVADLLNCLDTSSEMNMIVICEFMLRFPQQSHAARAGWIKIGLATFRYLVMNDASISDYSCTSYARLLNICENLDTRSSETKYVVQFLNLYHESLAGMVYRLGNVVSTLVYLSETLQMLSSKSCSKGVSFLLIENLLYGIGNHTHIQHLVRCSVGLHEALNYTDRLHMFSLLQSLSVWWKLFFPSCSYRSKSNHYDIHTHEFSLGSVYDDVNCVCNRGAPDKHVFVCTPCLNAALKWLCLGQQSTMSNNQGVLQMLAAALHSPGTIHPRWSLVVLDTLAPILTRFLPKICSNFRRLMSISGEANNSTDNVIYHTSPRTSEIQCNTSALDEQISGLRTVNNERGAQSKWCEMGSLDELQDPSSEHALSLRLWTITCTEIIVHLIHGAPVSDLSEFCIPIEASSPISNPSTSCKWPVVPDGNLSDILAERIDNTIEYDMISKILNLLRCQDNNELHTPSSMGSFTEGACLPLSCTNIIQVLLAWLKKHNSLPPALRNLISGAAPTKIMLLLIFVVSTGKLREFLDALHTVLDIDEEITVHPSDSWETLDFVGQIWRSVMELRNLFMLSTSVPAETGTKADDFETESPNNVAEKLFARLGDRRFVCDTKSQIHVQSVAYQMAAICLLLNNFEGFAPPRNSNDFKSRLASVRGTMRYLLSNAVDCTSVAIDFRRSLHIKSCAQRAIAMASHLLKTSDDSFGCVEELLVGISQLYDFDENRVADARGRALHATVITDSFSNLLDMRQDVLDILKCKLSSALNQGFNLTSSIPCPSLTPCQNISSLTSIICQLMQEISSSTPCRRLQATVLVVLRLRPLSDLTVEEVLRALLVLLDRCVDDSRLRNITPMLVAAFQSVISETRLSPTNRNETVDELAYLDNSLDEKLVQICLDLIHQSPSCDIVADICLTDRLTLNLTHVCFEREHNLQSPLSDSTLQMIMIGIADTSPKPHRIALQLLYYLTPRIRLSYAEEIWNRTIPGSCTLVEFIFHTVDIAYNFSSIPSFDTGKFTSMNIIGCGYSQSSRARSARRFLRACLEPFDRHFNDTAQCSKESLQIYQEWVDCVRTNVKQRLEAAISAAELPVISPPSQALSDSDDEDSTNAPNASGVFHSSARPPLPPQRTGESLNDSRIDLTRMLSVIRLLNSSPDGFFPGDVVSLLHSSDCNEALISSACTAIESRNTDSFTDSELTSLIEISRSFSGPPGDAIIIGVKTNPYIIYILPLRDLRQWRTSCAISNGDMHHLKELTKLVRIGGTASVRLARTNHLPKYAESWAPQLLTLVHKGVLEFDPESSMTQCALRASLAYEAINLLQCIASHDDLLLNHASLITEVAMRASFWTIKTNECCVPHVLESRLLLLRHMYLESRVGMHWLNQRKLARSSAHTNLAALTKQYSEEIATLKGLGFEQELCLKALEFNRFDAERAAEWLYSPHASIFVQGGGLGSSSNKTQNYVKGDAHELALAAGAPPKLCSHVLDMVDGDKNQAMSWILDWGGYYSTLPDYARDAQDVSSWTGREEEHQLSDSGILKSIDQENTYTGRGTKLQSASSSAAGHPAAAAGAASTRPESAVDSNEAGDNDQTISLTESSQDTANLPTFQIRGSLAVQTEPLLMTGGVSGTRFTPGLVLALSPAISSHTSTRSNRLNMVVSTLDQYVTVVVTDEYAEDGGLNVCACDGESRCVTPMIMDLDHLQSITQICSWTLSESASDLDSCLQRYSVAVTAQRARRIVLQCLCPWPRAQPLPLPLFGGPNGVLQFAKLLASSECIFESAGESSTGDVGSVGSNREEMFGSENTSSAMRVLKSIFRAAITENLKFHGSLASTPNTKDADDQHDDKSISSDGKSSIIAVSRPSSPQIMRQMQSRLNRLLVAAADALSLSSAAAATTDDANISTKNNQETADLLARPKSDDANLTMTSCLVQDVVWNVATATQIKSTGNPLECESLHPHFWNCDYSKSVVYPGAKALLVTFDARCRLSTGNAQLMFFSPEDESCVVRLISSNTPDFSPLIFRGDTVKYRFACRLGRRTDAWGFHFRVSPIQGVQWLSEHDALSSVSLEWAMWELQFLLTLQDRSQISNLVRIGAIINALLQYLRHSSAPFKLRVVFILTKAFQCYELLGRESLPDFELVRRFADIVAERHQQEKSKQNVFLPQNLQAVAEMCATALTAKDVIMSGQLPVPLDASEAFTQGGFLKRPHLKQPPVWPQNSRSISEAKLRGIDCLRYLRRLLDVLEVGARLPDQFAAMIAVACHGRNGWSTLSETLDSIEQTMSRISEKKLEEIVAGNLSWTSTADAALARIGLRLAQANGATPHELNMPAVKMSAINDYPELTGTIENMSDTKLQARFGAMQLMNRLLSKCIELIDLSRAQDPNSLANALRRMSHWIFPDTKHSLVEAAIDATWSSDTRIFGIELDNNLAFQARDAQIVDPSISYCVFMQVYRQLSRIEPRYLRKHVDDKGRLFVVRFREEDGLDWGGLYRDTMVRMMEDVFSSHLDLCISTPNAKAQTSTLIDKYIPNPRHDSDASLHIFRFLGRMMGIAMRQKQYLPFAFPTYIWKKIVGQKVELDDIIEIQQTTGIRLKRLNILLQSNEASAQSEIQKMIEDTFFVIEAFDGTLIELLTNGSERPVTMADVSLYVSLAISAKLEEVDLQINAILRGLVDIVPERAVSLCNASDLESLVCGDPHIDIDILRARTVLRGYSKNDKVIKWLWKVLEEFDNEQRSRFLRFVWGRTRLPRGNWERNFQIARKHEDDTALPIGHTCFFQIELPSYSSEDILRQRLTTAITYGLDGFLIA